MTDSQSCGSPTSACCTDSNLLQTFQTKVSGRKRSEAFKRRLAFSIDSITLYPCSSIFQGNVLLSTTLMAHEDQEHSISFSIPGSYGDILSMP